MRRLALGAVLLSLGCPGPENASAPGPREPVADRAASPAVGLHTDGGYVGSQRCAPCHEASHASWSRSYHRTMTQTPSAAAVAGRFDGAVLDSAGHYRAFERDGEFFVTQPAADGGIVESPVELVTGSHHMQVYWVRSAAGTLEAFAFAFLLPEQRWVPNEWTLMRPPAEHDALAGEPVEAVYTWNRVCVKCHAVDGVPGYDAASRTTTTTAAELGIACEACHGPGREHVEAWKGREADPLAEGADDPTMVDPRELGARRGSEVCGQCHSISVFHDDPAWVARGRDEPPPSPLSSWGRVVQHPLKAGGPWTDALLDTDPEFFSQRYWSDGEVRVSGREYNGLIDSPCFASADFGCTTCHRMHATDAEVDGGPWVAGQLRAGARNGETCGRCHASIATEARGHSGHAMDQASCVDCHMPRTTYGLLGAIRSHTISSPSVDTTLVTGRPLACNLCHVDRSLAWSARMLERDFEQTVPEGVRPPCTPEEETRAVTGCLPAVAEWLVAGDAGQRALAAWHLGWRGSKAPAWAGPLLDSLVRGDPYPAVRLVAERARAQTGAGGPSPTWAQALRSRRDDREVRLAE